MLDDIQQAQVEAAENAVVEKLRRKGLLPNDEQPAPIQNTSTPVWELVIADMRERDHVGRQRYGTPLQANNGRDALIDAYQEALDLAVYLRQCIEERK